MTEKNSLNLDWTESLAKLIPGAATVLIGVYLLGFVIVSSYLNKFGIRSSEIFEFRYLSIGIIFLAIFAANAVIHFWSLGADLTTRAETVGQYLARKLRLFLGFFMVNFAIAFLILPGIAANLKFKNPGMYVALVFIVFVVLEEVRFKRKIEHIRDLVELLLFITLGILLRKSQLPVFIFWAFFLQVFLIFTFDIQEVELLKRLTRLEKRGFWVFRSAFLLIGLLFGCYIFGNLFYDKVPRYFGGGEPRIVQIIVPDNEIAVLNQLGIGAKGGSLTPSLFLIHDTDTEYYILTPAPSKKPRAIGIRKDIVKGIVLSQ